MERLQSRGRALLLHIAIQVIADVGPNHFENVDVVFAFDFRSRDETPVELCTLLLDARPAASACFVVDLVRSKRLLYLFLSFFTFLSRCFSSFSGASPLFPAVLLGTLLPTCGNTPTIVRSLSPVRALVFFVVVSPDRFNLEFRCSSFLKGAAPILFHSHIPF